MCTATGSPCAAAASQIGSNIGLSVGSPGLLRKPAPNQLGMHGKTFDLGDRTFRVLGVDPDGAAEAPSGVGLQPSVQQPVVDRGANSAVEQIVGDVAAGQRVQDGVLDAQVVKEMAGNGFRIRARVMLSI